jgi:flagellar basal-body rod modification protein FlgD
VADFDNAVQSASLSVYDKQGQLVDKFALGPQEAGKQEFYWTGTDANDQRYPSGEYRFELSASNGGESTTLPTYLSANVNSVTIEKSGNLTLNLAGVGSVSMSEVIQIN